MGAQTDVERDFADSTSRLVDMLMPNATPQARLEALRAFATIASCTMLQTVHHVTGHTAHWDAK